MQAHHLDSAINYLASLDHIQMSDLVLKDLSRSYACLHQNHLVNSWTHWFVLGLLRDLMVIASPSWQATSAMFVSL